MSKTTKGILKIIAMCFFIAVFSSPALAIQIFPGVVEETANSGEVLEIKYTLMNDQPDTYIMTMSAMPWSYPNGDPVEPASWLKYDTTPLIFGPWEKKEIIVEATALENIEGEIRAMVFFEQRPEVEAGGPFGTITRRMGNVLYLGIRGTMIAGLDVESIELENITNAEGIPGLSGQFFFRNSGNVHVRPRVTVRFMKEGEMILEGQLFFGSVVYPGVVKMIPFTMDNTHLEDGFYTMSVKSTYLGMDIDHEVFEATVENGNISLRSLEVSPEDVIPEF